MKSATWKKRIKADCMAAGTYADWADPVIDTLADILEKRDAAQEQYEKMGGGPIVKHTNKAGATNLVKHPALMAVNDLNTSALAYWRELGLTPSAFRKLTGDAPKEKKPSVLAEVLKDLGM